MAPEEIFQEGEEIEMEDVERIVERNNKRMLGYLAEEARTNAAAEARMKGYSKTWEHERARENLKEANQFISAIRSGDQGKVRRFVRTGGKRISKRQYGEALVIMTEGLRGRK